MVARENVYCGLFPSVCARTCILVRTFSTFAVLLAVTAERSLFFFISLMAYPQCNEALVTIRRCFVIGQALAYMLVFLRKGRLPWTDVKADTKIERFTGILEIKRAMSAEDVCEGMPPAFAQFLTMCREMRFDDPPDYDVLRALLEMKEVRTHDQGDGRPRGAPVELEPGRLRLT